MILFSENNIVKIVDVVAVNHTPLRCLIQFRSGLSFAIYAPAPWEHDTYLFPTGEIVTVPNVLALAPYTPYYDSVVIYSHADLVRLKEKAEQVANGKSEYEFWTKHFNQ
jgi:hypothetical protein